MREAGVRSQQYSWVKVRGKELLVLVKWDRLWAVAVKFRALERNAREDQRGLWKPQSPETAEAPQ